jgi:catechol 2,3-dioxygenase-like lactoylglutathione lyase family enzyme
MAHVVLVLDQWEASTAFYRSLLSFVGFVCVADTDRGHGSYDRTPFLYYVGGRTAVGFHRSEGENRGVAFDQSRAGMHHWCLRARNPEAVDAIEHHFHAHLSELGGTMIRPASESTFAPGYYSLLMEDPEGQRVEFNYVPGKG